MDKIHIEALYDAFTKFQSAQSRVLHDEPSAAWGKKLTEAGAAFRLALGPLADHIDWTSPDGTEPPAPQVHVVLQTSYSPGDGDGAREHVSVAGVYTTAKKADDHVNARTPPTTVISHWSPTYEVEPITLDVPQF